MPAPLTDWVVIGENVHATRIITTKNKRYVDEPGEESIRFDDLAGEPRLLRIPDELKSGQDFRQRRIKHIKAAMLAVMGGDDPDGGAEYLRRVVADQVAAGSHFIDVNVDEISVKPDEQRGAMRAMVELLEEATELPLSIDSSDPKVIEVGLDAATSGRRPMLNSASLERQDVLQIGIERGARIIVTAAGDAGMPDDAAERVANASQMIEAALQGGVAPEDIYVDPLVFPASVDGRYAQDALDAMRIIRSEFGDEIHVTGGMSNVSFGLPARSIVNAVFIALARESGADSGIIDPVVNRLERVMSMDKGSTAYALAKRALLGEDDHCLEYISAWRAGELGTL